MKKFFGQFWFPFLGLTFIKIGLFFSPFVWVHLPIYHRCLSVIFHLPLFGSNIFFFLYLSIYISLHSHLLSLTPLLPSLSNLSLTLAQPCLTTLITLFLYVSPLFLPSPYLHTFTFPPSNPFSLSSSLPLTLPSSPTTATEVSLLFWLPLLSSPLSSSLVHGLTDSVQYLGSIHLKMCVLLSW